MITIPCQIGEHQHLIPMGDDARDALTEYHVNKPVTCKITGMSAKKERSVIALNLLMACCELVANNNEDQHWNTKDKVKFQLKVAINFIDASKTIVDPQGNVHLHYRSFGFESLPHMESVKVFDQAYPILSGKIGVSIDELVSNAKAKMKKR